MPQFDDQSVDSHMQLPAIKAYMKSNVVASGKSKLVISLVTIEPSQNIVFTHHRPNVIDNCIKGLHNSMLQSIVHLASPLPHNPPLPPQFEVLL
jgi:hypothetical protein